MRILIILIWILTGIVTGVVASDKGHGFGSWAFVGFLLGPLGLIAVTGLSDQKLRQYLSQRSPHFNIENPKKFLDQTHRTTDSYPKLLTQSQGIFGDQTKRLPQDKYIADFLFNKNASEHQIWKKIIEVLDFHRPEIASLADRTVSNANLSLTGRNSYLICDANGGKLALAYAKENVDDNNYYWQIRIY